MLADNLKTLLGSTFVIYTKTHGFHWNIEGSDFPQYHKFLNKMYEEIYETIDKKDIGIEGEKPSFDEVLDYLLDVQEETSFGEEAHDLGFIGTQAP